MLYKIDRFSILGFGPITCRRQAENLKRDYDKVGNFLRHLDLAQLISRTNSAII